MREVSRPFDGFDDIEVDTGECTIFLRRGGRGPGLLLLHGFPETHLMWREIAPLLADGFTVVAPDLRGYGRSGCPPSSADHLPYSKRAMARDLVSVMNQLGLHRFSVVGHDRGGRVAYRLALDSPESVRSVAVLDVVTTLDAWERADARFAAAFWPWSLLAQPEPLPERLILSRPDAVVDAAIGGWGTPAGVFPAEVRRAYIEALSDGAHVHAICEEYRAAATIDAEHDRDDRDAGRRITCPLLVLWSSRGPLDSWYAADGGPLGLWRGWARDVRGKALDAGHFFPEEIPARTVGELRAFLHEVSR